MDISQQLFVLIGTHLEVVSDITNNQSAERIGREQAFGYQNLPKLPFQDKNFPWMSFYFFPLLIDHRVLPGEEVHE